VVGDVPWARDGKVIRIPAAGAATTEDDSPVVEAQGL
jgi:hypothetical protein